MAAPRRISRDKILDVAADLFAEKGYDGTSITDITDALKITRPTLYAHAKSKADLLEGINQRLLDFFKGNFAAFVRPQDPPTKRIEGFIRLQLDATRYFPSSFRLAMRSAHDASLPHSPALQEMWHHHDEVMSRAIEEAQQKNQITREIPPKILKHLIWGALNEIPYWYRPFGPLSAEELTGHILNFLTSAVPPGGSKDKVVKHYVSRADSMEVAREWRFETCSVGEHKVMTRAHVPTHSILYGTHQMTAAIAGLVIWTCESFFREVPQPRKGEWVLQDLSLRFFPPIVGGVILCQAERSLFTRKIEIWDVKVTHEDHHEALCLTRAIYGK